MGYLAKKSSKIAQALEAVIVIKLARKDFKLLNLIFIVIRKCYFIEIKLFPYN